MPLIQCRRCGKVLQYQKVTDLPFFPFCSDRCKLIDLGAWLDESHRIPDTDPSTPDALPDAQPDTLDNPPEKDSRPKTRRGKR